LIRSLSDFLKELREDEYLSISYRLEEILGMMNTLQLIHTMLKFNINVPPNAYVFFKYLDEFLSMKAKFIEDYLDEFNNLFISSEKDLSEESDKQYN
jgi:hypothetical protein